MACADMRITHQSVNGARHPASGAASSDVAPRLQIRRIPAYPAHPVGQRAQFIGERRRQLPKNRVDCRS
jgi:hypothetical protein